MTRFTPLKGMAMALALGMLPLAAGPAFAHAHLATAVPAVDATVSAPLPAELRLTFSEAVEIVFTHVIATDATGAAISLGKPAIDPADPQTVVVPIEGQLPAGDVKVVWDTVATDGHKSDGSYTLTIAP